MCNRCKLKRRKILDDFEEMGKQHERALEATLKHRFCSKEWSDVI